MPSCTASAVVTFAVQLEVACAEFYEDIARTCETEQDVFMELAQENLRNGKLLKRAYYEVVSDALETGFCFEGLELSEHTVDCRQPEGLSRSEIITLALACEDKAERLCQIAAERSESLLGDVPRVFAKLARQREDRKTMLSKLL